MRGASFALILAACAAPAVRGDPGLTLWRGRIAEPFVSPEYAVEPFDRAVLSWNATGPAVFELEVAGRRHVLGRWGPEPRSQKTSEVDVDTLVLREPACAFRFRVTPEPGAVVTLVAVTRWKDGERRPYQAEPSAAWGKVLDVPCRSQVVEARDPGEICSPTSVSMVLEYHGFRKTTREVCEGVFDRGEKIYGNWPFNTAFAHQVSGREAFVLRAGGLEEVEAEIAAGRPVVLSHRWKPGDLDGAPLAQSDGHLIVVAGFTETGDVVVNDPAARPDAVRRVYKRRQLYTTWLERASGILYVIR